MKKILAAFIFVLAIYSVNAADKGKVVSLFDGKTFKGWAGDTNKTWRIENGALVGTGSMTAVCTKKENGELRAIDLPADVIDRLQAAAGAPAATEL